MAGSGSSLRGTHRRRRNGGGLAAGALAAIALLAAGCGGVESTERAYGLDRAVRTYSHAVRWNKLAEANAYARPRDGELQPYDPKVYEGLSVLSNDLSIGALNDELDEAGVDMNFGYHWDDSAVVRSLSQQTVWYWDDEDGRWYLDGGLPVFPGR
ncbi:MAG: hypothetical protein ACR2RL_13535 [Gammaproteobacteria bacterium]